MKRTLLFAIATMLTASTVFAQDLAVETLEGPNGNYLRKGVSANILVKVVNQGSSPITVGNVITLGIQYDNDAPIQQSKLLQSDLAPAGEIFLHFEPTFTNHALGPVKVCVWGSYGGDPDHSNDTACKTFELVTYKRDIGITAIPIPLPNTEIEHGANYSFSFTLKNFSDSVIKVGTIIPYQVKFGSGNPQDFSVTLTTDFVSKTEATYSTPVFQLPANTPEGDIQVCFTSNFGSQVDDNAANNQTCNTYTVTGTGIVENNFNGAVAIQPNPLHHSTQFSYTLITPSEVVLNIFSLNGKEVKTLVNGKQSAGLHTIDFDASGLEKGVYIYRLQSGAGAKTGNLVLE